mmetsp:Transcript_98272/g.204966  ORF Transcript_98272/g.204966 Transcript_98272/m.204966 type:complete len:127 (-) Transcript_98272:305-685(-)|eukprot:CAMPEP_0195036904 /NCGR_PEP_ID=MMETSP0326_2-20130528/73674_1 /TAXON_ID=2866 ORGANISM="Crypthecodinium cohnii, Strain Seligo" /NCGR_SAMPLE_ID=MMETSP0326_2 /ASSEMBLY_ACC=CAM_ASM_000348 /LENGTH=126 /DNA_ID=CAMNT_0040062691 /DNA_START=72 /DNA_END=452 /DNA_ORIENTATION=-
MGASLVQPVACKAATTCEDCAAVVGGAVGEITEWSGPSDGHVFMQITGLEALEKERIDPWAIREQAKASAIKGENPNGDLIADVYNGDAIVMQDNTAELLDERSNKDEQACQGEVHHDEPLRVVHE